MSMNLIERFHHWRRKMRWDKQYKSGRWDSLQSEKELSRYEKIIELMKTHGISNPSILDIGCGYNANKFANVICDIQDLSNYYPNKKFAKLTDKKLPCACRTPLTPIFAV